MAEHVLDECRFLGKRVPAVDYESNERKLEILDISNMFGSTKTLDEKVTEKVIVIPTETKTSFTEDNIDREEKEEPKLLDPEYGWKFVCHLCGFTCSQSSSENDAGRLAPTMDITQHQAICGKDLRASFDIHTLTNDNEQLSPMNDLQTSLN